MSTLERAPANPEAISAQYGVAVSAAHESLHKLGVFTIIQANSTPPIHLGAVYTGELPPNISELPLHELTQYMALMNGLLSYLDSRLGQYQSERNTAKEVYERTLLAITKKASQENRKYSEIDSYVLDRRCEYHKLDIIVGYLENARETVNKKSMILSRLLSAAQARNQLDTRVNNMTHLPSLAQRR